MARQRPNIHRQDPLEDSRALTSSAGVSATAARYIPDPFSFLPSVGLLSPTLCVPFIPFSIPASQLRYPAVRVPANKC
ncbi:hypothetical protein BDW71DRAFT_105166 [Aspergillus fruticulosus]